MVALIRLQRSVYWSESSLYRNSLHSFRCGWNSYQAEKGTTINLDSQNFHPICVKQTPPPPSPPLKTSNHVSFNSTPLKTIRLNPFSSTDQNRYICYFKQYRSLWQALENQILHCLLFLFDFWLDIPTWNNGGIQIKTGIVHPLLKIRNAKVVVGWLCLQHDIFNSCSAE